MNSSLALRMIQASRPVQPDCHRITTLHGPVVFDVATSRFRMTEEATVAERGPRLPVRPKMRALSLAVAQTCNLGCTYCYAQGGTFGQPARAMTLAVAIQAIDRLVAEAEAGETIHISFLGGEPLINRPVLQAATKHAADQSLRCGVKASFALTTNGTLLTPADGDFFEAHGFAVTISLDGEKDAHDSLRAHRDGRGSYEEIVRRVQPLLAQQKRMQVSARATITPRNLELRRSLDHLLGLGFHSVGFSPMLSSPTGKDEMEPGSLETMLEQMIACGIEFERHVVAGRRFPFLNMVNAMREIHRGSRRPLPCGAGEGYFGVGADGELFACHRFVGEERASLGSIGAGVDRAKQESWLEERQVDRQEPCRSCWARYLCGGGCHHEVIHRGRVACDFIRGWLHYSLGAYHRLLSVRPDYFAE